MNVAEIMAKNVITVRPETSLKEVAQILAERDISGVPVVDTAGTLVGVVSEGDILFKERGPSGRRGMRAWLLDPYGMEGQLKFEAHTAGAAMTSPAITIHSYRPVAAAAAEMLERHVNRLPVLDGEERLVGIVTRADLVRAFVRSDELVAREIRDVIARALWMSADAVSVAVKNGEVRLRGTTETEVEADTMIRLVRRVPGVVAVDADLAWRPDGRVS
jgi:CBS-domain-containing membrane protein